MLWLIVFLIKTSQYYIVGLAFTSSGQTIATFERKISQHCWAQPFGHPVASCCDMLGIQNRTNAHVRGQHCCTNLAKRLQHHATSTNVAWKIWPFSNLSQQHQTYRNPSQQGGQTHATYCAQQWCVRKFRSFSQGLAFIIDYIQYSSSWCKKRFSQEPIDDLLGSTESLSRFT